MSEKGVTRLFNVKFGKKGEISLVRAGANLRQTLLTKSQEESMEELLKELLENGFENEVEFQKKLEKLLPSSLKKEDSEKVTSGLQGAFAILSKVKDSIPKDAQAALLISLLKDAGFETEAEEVVKASDFGNFLRDKMKEKKVSKEDLAKAGSMSTETLDSLLSGDLQAPSKKSLEGLAKALGASKDDLAKLFPSSVQKMFTEEESVADPVIIKKGDDDPSTVAIADLKKELSGKYDDVIADLKKDAKTAQEDLKKEKDLRLEKEFEDKAKGFGYVGDKAVEIGKSLKEAQEGMSETGYKAIEAQIEKAGKVLQSADLVKELGGGGTDTTEFESEVGAKVAELMKADTELTKEQAEVKVYDRYPALYNSYLDSNPKQGGR